MITLLTQSKLVWTQLRLIFDRVDCKHIQLLKFTTIFLVHPSILWPVQVQTIIHKATNPNRIFKETNHYVSTDDQRPYPKYHTK